LAWTKKENGLVVRPEQVKFKFLEKKGEILLTKKAEKKIRYLLSKYPSMEWMAGLIGHPDKNNVWVIEDLYLMEQELQSAHVEPTSEGQVEFSKVKGNIGWIHSHNKMSAYFSSQDWETAEMYNVSICVNNELDFFAASTIQIDCVESKSHGKILLKEADVFLEPNDEMEKGISEILKRFSGCKIEKEYGRVNKITIEVTPEMMKETKPEIVIVTTIDSNHHEFIIKGMER